MSGTENGVRRRPLPGMATAFAAAIVGLPWFGFVYVTSTFRPEWWARTELVNDLSLIMLLACIMMLLLGVALGRSGSSAE